MAGLYSAFLSIQLAGLIELICFFVACFFQSPAPLYPYKLFVSSFCSHFLFSDKKLCEDQAVVLFETRVGTNSSTQKWSFYFSRGLFFILLKKKKKIFILK